jgi:hypothetical protein
MDVCELTAAKRRSVLKFAKIDGRLVEGEASGSDHPLPHSEFKSEQFSIGSSRVTPCQRDRASIERK